MDDENTPLMLAERFDSSNRAERRISVYDRDRVTIMIALSDGAGMEKRIDGGALLPSAPRKAGSAIILPPDRKLEGWTSGPASFLRLSIGPKALQLAAREPYGRGSAELTPRFQIHDWRLWTVSQLLLDELRNGRPGGQLFMDSISHFFAFHLLDKYSVDNEQGSSGHLIERPQTRPLVSFQLKRALTFIRDSLHEEISLDAIAAASGMSPAHFSRSFRAAMGVSPWRYVLDCRLEQGKELLETTDFTIKNVARIVGFAGSTAFITSFRRRYGVAPGTYRISFKR